jgi:hypothetical protein
MLLLMEATLFFWDIVHSDSSKTKKELAMRITKWRGSVAGPKKKVHMHTLSHLLGLNLFTLI